MVVFLSRDHHVHRLRDFDFIDRVDNNGTSAAAFIG